MKVAKQPQRHVAVLDFIAADQQQHGDGHCADGIHERRTDGLNAHAAQVGAEQALGRILEAQNLPQLGIERFHDAVAGHGFVQNVLNLGQLVLAGARARAHLPADLARRGDHHGNKQHERPAQDGRPVRSPTPLSPER